MRLPPMPIAQLSLVLPGYSLSQSQRKELNLSLPYHSPLVNISLRLSAFPGSTLYLRVILPLSVLFSFANATPWHTPIAKSAAKLSLSPFIFAPFNIFHLCSDIRSCSRELSHWVCWICPHFLFSLRSYSQHRIPARFYPL